MDRATIGSKVIDTIIESKLLTVDSEEPRVFVWSGNAPEQIGETIFDFFTDLLEWDDTDAAIRALVLRNVGRNKIGGLLGVNQKRIQAVIKRMQEGGGE